MTTAFDPGQLWRSHAADDGGVSRLDAAVIAVGCRIFG
jgi:hypothetical protein